jgi:hypothetical protein
MELSRMSYIDVLKMPVYVVDEYLTWKIKFDQDKEKAKSESIDKLKM